MIRNLQQMREEVGSDEFANLLGATMNKRLMKAYNWVLGAYNAYCDIVEVADFKNQTIIDLTDLDDLELVPEGAEYQEWSFDESTDTYRVYKRGKKLTVPWEWIQNDDLRAINRVVDNMGRAARRSVAKFAVGLLTATPASVTVTAALSSTTLPAAINELESRADTTSGEKLGLVARKLIVPTALQFTADQLVNSSLIVATGDTDAVIGNKNTLANRLEVVVDPFLTDENDWYVGTDPVEYPGIELAFLRGYRNGPAMLRKKTDSQEELDFDTESYVYKCRHVYGGKRINSNALVHVSVT